jgi:hypothetical protein
MLLTLQLQFSFQDVYNKNMITPQMNDYISQNHQYPKQGKKNAVITLLQNHIVSTFKVYTSAIKSIILAANSLNF